MDAEHDPVGLALLDRARFGKATDIIVESEHADDDIFPVDYFFRTYEMMPEIEQVALDQSFGNVLDVGAGGGCHAVILQQKGLRVKAIDTSAGAVELMNMAGISATKNTIFNLPDEQFDTILILMNGIGLAESMDKIGLFLARLKQLLAPGGKIFCDSTDIAYLYTQEDGSFLIDLNSGYYGEMRFNMKYKNVESGWFSWLYIDFENLSWHAAEAGLTCTLACEGSTHNYLACLEHS
jgi:hypothetical protein